MKKTLIALAAVAATSAAFAQSSVTLYGVADASIAKSTGSSTAFTSAGTMNNGTSRWGVRGTEDLGGGLKAGFNFEQGLSLADGSSGASAAAVARNPAAASPNFSRGAYLTLGGGFGEASLGRRLNPAFYTAAAWELTGAANYSVVVNQFGAVLNGIRYNDMLMYTSPSFGGVTVQYAHVLKGDRLADKATNDISVRYAAGPLSIAANWNKDEEDAAGSKHVGASYNFGAFKVAGAYINPVGPAEGFSIGGSTNMGPVALTLDIARDTEYKDTDLLIEGKYALSKRTTAYVAFLRDGGSDKPKAAGAAVKNASNVNNFGLGIRHNF